MNFANADKVSRVAAADDATDAREPSPQPSETGGNANNQPVSPPISGKSPKENRLVRAPSSLAHDVTHVREALQAMQEFFFMRSDSRPVHGLQDWPLKQWEEYLTKHPLEANQLVQTLFKNKDPKQLLSNGKFDECDPGKAALDIKQLFNTALTKEEWVKVCEFQSKALNALFDRENQAVIHYMSGPLLSRLLFNREFPLGVDESVMRNIYSFAIKNSGLNRVQHKESGFISILVYAFLCSGVFCGFCYLLYLLVVKSDVWTMEATHQFAKDNPLFDSYALKLRTKTRGTVASLLTGFTFSLTVNATLDKFGKIDPSSSTVFIGMTLGGTWGFLLDNMIGSDEGFREYLWNPVDGMRFAMGSLRSARFGRYVVTILFDMFFTVILFKMLFSKLVQFAGFTVRGREWIANGFCSGIISVLTFQVYANMTRFEWAYPSGEEHEMNQWISGNTMCLCTVIMNSVWLVTETRCRVNEPGINDPNVKLVVTAFTYFTLWGLQAVDGIIDPTVEEVRMSTTNHTADFTDPNLPLKHVCDMLSRSSQGFAFFFFIAAFCVGFVVFGTSQQSFEGLLDECSWCTRRRKQNEASEAAPAEDIESRPSSSGSGRRASIRPNMIVDDEGHAVGLQDRDEKDHLKGKLALFVLYMSIIVVIVMVFTFVPILGNRSDLGERSYTSSPYNGSWEVACSKFNEIELDHWGLS